MYNHLPFEGYSYYIDSENTYHLGVLVPYGTYNYRVEVLFPVLSIVEQTTVLPKIELHQFQTWVKSTKFIINDENDELYDLTMLLLDIAKNVVSYDLCGGDNEWIRAVSYYVAHYLEKHIDLLKDEQNKMTMTPEKKNEVDTAEEIKMEMTDSDEGDFKTTLWGRMYWTIYGKRAKFLVGYMPL